MNPCDRIPVDPPIGTNGGLAVDARHRIRLAAGETTGEAVSGVIDLGASGRIRLDWRERWTAPQRWEKHPGNPVLTPRQTGVWDTWCNGVSVVRNPDGRSYKMFYAGRKGAGIGFAEARLDNPLSWTEHPASPVLRPAADNWEGNQINQPRVVKVTGSHWRMYYTGWGITTGGSPWAVGLAESFDAGVTWKRVTADPILERGEPGAPDDGGACVPEVRRVGDRWFAWYTAMKLNGDRQSIHLCLATSADGLTWVKHPGNPVLSDDFTAGPARNVISRCHVRYDYGVFRMWYSHAKPDYRIRYAESLDGVHWERSPVPLALDVSPSPAWDDRMVEYPELDVVDGQWRLWFCGNGFGSVGFASGAVEAGALVSVRSGTKPTPESGWTGWSPAPCDETLDVGRYVQARVLLWSRIPRLSPVIECLALHRTVGQGPNMLQDNGKDRGQRVVLSAGPDRGTVML